MRLSSARACAGRRDRRRSPLVLRRSCGLRHPLAFPVCDSQVKAKEAESFKSKIMLVLSTFVGALLVANVGLAFLAVHLGKQLDFDGNGDGVSFLAGTDTVATSGDAVHMFKLADAPMLSPDFLGEVERVTVLFDKRLHTLNIASFEWASDGSLTLRADDARFEIVVDNGSVSVFERTEVGTGEWNEHLVYAPDYAVDTSTPKKQWDTWFSTVLSRVPDHCQAQFNAAFNTPTTAEPKITLVDDPQISRMCYEAHSLADPLNRGGALETRTALQSHGLADWELAAIDAEETRVKTAQGAGSEIGSFTIQSAEDLRANLAAYNDAVDRLGYN